MDHGYPKKIVSSFGNIGRVDAAFQKDGELNLPLPCVYVNIWASIDRIIFSKSCY